MVARRRLRLPIAEYRAKGWDVFPLPLGVKGPPPKGVTGYNARPITEADYRRWSGTYQNYAIIMPDGVVGIDIDVYKHGETALKVIGELPATIRSTSRDDGSGIYLYRLPPGTKLNGNIPGAGEVIQPFHRYGVVWPSVHPDGYEYLWLNGRDQEVAIPHIDDLPELPPAWIKRLQAPPGKHSTRDGRHSGKGYEGDVNDWLRALPKGALTPPVRTTLRNAIRELRRYAMTGDCRYDSMRNSVGRLVGLGARRERGAEEAIDDLFTEYTVALDGEPDRDPEAEYIRALEGAVAKWGRR